MGLFDGKLVFITGASAGIGRALALEFAREGASLALVARREERLRELDGELRALGRRVLSIVADVSVDGELQRAVAATHVSLGVIDVVVANAGFGVSGRFEELTIDDYRRQFETNVFGVLRTMYSTIDDLKEKKGILVLLGSVAGYMSQPGGSAYAMSKYAIRSLAEATRKELQPHGVGVVLVSPGLIESEFRLIDNFGKMREGARDSAPAWLQMPTGKAARKIVAAVAMRKRERILTGHGKFLVFLSHHFPRTLRFLVGQRIFRAKK